ncbi:AAA family ATPase [Spiractinospora alimapuensis]|uniref:AAA family ATPase n=1 Tax=Spiractinospora alimapuensis TaxID=2820884 RepID=UPI001F3F9A8D|nr:AAA family ATPase [Spiractinospora alimapuensis]QVQ53388.1 AAA family ATPase [Spiractinospora alimapuensis]
MPAASPHFVNRERELETMRELVEADASADRSALLCVVGLGGVGKTGLALRFLHSLEADAFAGFFYVDLRGFSRGRPVGPSDVLAQFLCALGVPPPAVPSDLASRAAWWRTATADQRHAILLDNASSAAQARALLPGAGGHLVIVTSRRRLDGLTINGARFLRLEPLRVDDAAELLRRMSARLHAQSDLEATRRMAQLCGGLPIAVNSVAVRAASGRSLVAVAADLEGRRRRLSVLSGEEEEHASVQAAFDLSYDALPEEARVPYHRLGWHIGPDITVDATRILTGLDAAESESALDTLVAANLLTPVGEGRYRFHDLLALHALAKAHAQESESEQSAALTRLTTYYAERARAADKALRPYASSGKSESVPFDAPVAALAWLVRERDNLLVYAEHAAENEDTDSAVGIAEGMWPLYLHHRDAQRWLRACDAALLVTTDPPTRARLLSKQGLAYGFLRQNDAADRAFAHSEAIWQHQGDLWRLSQVRQRRGLLANEMADYPTAVTHLTAALDIDHGQHQPHDRAVTLLGLGRALINTGATPSARPLLQEAVNLLSASRDDNHLSRAHVALARATMHTDPHTAHERLRNELAALQQRGSTLGRAEAHEALGDLHTHQNNTAEAAKHYETSIQLLRTMGSHTPATRIEERLDRLTR